MSERASRPPWQQERARRGSWWQPPAADSVEVPEFDDEQQPWVPLPPGSCVWHVAEDRRGFEVVAMRCCQPGQPLELVTRLGMVVWLGPDTELVVGKWSIGHDWR